MRGLRRKALVLFVVVLLVIGLALWFELPLKCVAWAARVQAEKMGGTLSYLELKWERGRLVCREGVLSCPGEFEVSWKEATFKPRLGRGGDVTLDGAQLILAHPLQLSSSSSSSSPLSIRVRDGEALLYDFSGKGPLLQRFEWGIDHGPKGGEVHVGVEPPLALTYEGSTFHTRFEGQELGSLCSLVRYFVSVDPSLDWVVKEGKIEGEATCRIEKGCVVALEGEVRVEDVSGENPSLGLRGSLSSLEAKGGYERGVPLELTTQLHECRVSIQEHHPELWKGMWDLYVPESNLSVKEGKVENSFFGGTLWGMEGTLALNWSSPEVLVRLNFSGDSPNMAPFMPDFLQKGFASAFPDDHFSLEATVKRKRGGVELAGNLVVGEEYPLSFGCHFGGQEGRVLPSATFVESLKEQFCLSSQRLGWVRGKQLPLEKFVTPFLLAEENVEALGRGDIEGTFDDRFLILLYQVDDFVLESPHFSLAADRVDESKNGEVVALHSYDFETGDQVGFFPFKEATYCHKRYDLELTESSGVARIENGKITIEEIESKWGGLEFAGEVELTLASLRDLDLWVRTERVEGPLSTVQQFLSLFCTTPFWDLPLQGELCSGEKGVEFHYRISPEDRLFEGKVGGDVSVSYANDLFALRDVCATCTYDFGRKEIVVERGEGACQLFSQVFPLKTHTLVFKRTPGWVFDVDLSLGEERIVGGSAVPGTFQLAGEKFELEARHSGSVCSIDKMRWKDQSLEAVLSWTEKGVFAQSCLLDVPAFGRCLCSGQFDKALGMVHGHLETFESDLTTFGVEGLCGVVGGKGTFEWDVHHHLLDVRAKGRGEGLSYREIPIEGKELVFHYTSQEGLVVEGLSSLNTPIGRFAYNPETDCIACEEANFSFAQGELPVLFSTLERVLPNTFTPALTAWIGECKREGALAGTLSFELYPRSTWVNLALADGEYTLGGKRLSLRSLAVTYDPLELNVTGECALRDNFYGVRLTTDTMSFTHGRLYFLERGDSLCLHWERQPEHGWCIREAEGRFCGLDLSLTARDKRDFSETIKLSGRVGLDASRLSSLLPLSWQKPLAKWQIGGGYALSGEFVVPKDDPAATTFHGRLLGEHFALGGGQFDSLAAFASYENGQFSVRNLFMEDLSGELHIEQAHVVHTHEGWELDVPSVHLWNCRPARLRAPDAMGKQKRLKALLIPAVTLYNLQGNLSDKKSLRGEGELHFTSIPKKGFFSNLLTIPTEITARIGLDFSLLIPASGTVRYQLYDGRVYLKTFQDVFSEGRRSRFYLVDDYPAYVDFEGNLNLKVKMKQYNLLMKLAEFFTVTIKGTVFKPSFTLMNQFEE